MARRPDRGRIGAGLRGLGPESCQNLAGLGRRPADSSRIRAGFRPHWAGFGRIPDSGRIRAAVRMRAGFKPGSSHIGPYWAGGRIRPGLGPDTGQGSDSDGG